MSDNYEKLNNMLADLELSVRELQGRVSGNKMLPSTARRTYQRIDNCKDMLESICEKIEADQKKEGGK